MAVKKKAHPLKGKAKSTAHRKAISEGLKRHHANKKKPSAVRTKTGKIKTDKKTLAAAHSKLDAIEKRAKARKAKKAAQAKSDKKFRVVRDRRPNW